MTIVFSNAHDDDCRILQRIWQGFDCNIVEITPSSIDYEDIVDNAIKNEHDTLILCGHGTSYGLLFPTLDRGEYIVHENNVNLINARNVICIWCYASTFCINHNLHCFATSMFITNQFEAIDNGIYNFTQDQINKTSECFQTEINWLLKNDIPLSEWVMRLGAHMNIENEIDVFNRQVLYFK